MRNPPPLNRASWGQSEEEHGGRKEGDLLLSQPHKVLLEAKSQLPSLFRDIMEKFNPPAHQAAATNVWAGFKLFVMHWSRRVGGGIFIRAWGSCFVTFVPVQNDHSLVHNPKHSVRHFWTLFLSPESGIPCNFPCLSSSTFLASLICTTSVSHFQNRFVSWLNSRDSTKANSLDLEKYENSSRQMLTSQLRAVNLCSAPALVFKCCFRSRKKVKFLRKSKLAKGTGGIVEAGGTQWLCNNPPHSQHDWGNEGAHHKTLVFLQNAPPSESFVEPRKEVDTVRPKNPNS